MAFLFSDTQIINESFVEDINNMLNSGEVPNIFPNDEKVAICEVLDIQCVMMFYLSLVLRCCRLVLRASLGGVSLPDTFLRTVPVRFCFPVIIIGDACCRRRRRKEAIRTI